MAEKVEEVILTCDKTAYSGNRLGIDIGGTDLKFGVVDDENNILYKERISTDNTGEEALITQIADKCGEIMKKYSIRAIGVGAPGYVINNCVTASNLSLDKAPIGKELEKRIGLPVKVENDANCAALGEKMAGTGKDCKNMIMITLGTGIGGGIIINGKIYTGRGVAGEIGDMIVEKDGKRCKCGQNGCWERYASTSALIEDATEKAKDNKDSVLYQLYTDNDNSLDGKLFFDALKRNCKIAVEVFDNYIEWLAMGLDNLVNIFDPDAIVLSGGITNEGELLLNPLKEKMKLTTEVRVSQLKSDAGILGAAILQ